MKKYAALIEREFDKDETRRTVGYCVEARGELAQVLKAAINQGIDSHLEGVTFVEGPEVVEHGRGLVFSLDKRGFKVLFRRLLEYAHGGFCERDYVESGGMDQTELRTSAGEACKEMLEGLNLGLGDLIVI